MPYVDPDDANSDVEVRFPGDPYPQPTTHNTFERRESTVGEILGDIGLYSPAYLPEIEGLMIAPGTSPTMTAESVAAYGDIVETAYTDACRYLTAAQREAWDLSREGLSLRDVAPKLGIDFSQVSRRLKRARARLSAALDWVIHPTLKAKYRKPKPPAEGRPLAWTLLMQQIGAELAKSDNDDQARWRLARLLSKAVDVGMCPTDLAKRTGIVPQVLAQLVSDFRNG